MINKKQYDWYSYGYSKISQDVFTTKTTCSVTNHKELINSLKTISASVCSRKISIHHRSKPLHFEKKNFEMTHRYNNIFSNQKSIREFGISGTKTLRHPDTWDAKKVGQKKARKSCTWENEVRENSITCPVTLPPLIFLSPNIIIDSFGVKISLLNLRWNWESYRGNLNYKFCV